MDAKGFKEGIGFVPIEAVDERVVSNEGIGCMPMETMETK